MRQVIKAAACSVCARLALQGLQLLHQCVLGIDFKHGLNVRYRLASLLEHARQLCAHAVLLRNETGGRIYQAGGGAYVFGFVFERFFELLKQRAGGFLRVLCGFFLVFVLQRA